MTESGDTAHEERQGEVVQCLGQRAKVQVMPAAGCARCAAGEGCGQGLLGAMRKASGPESFWVTVPGHETLVPGSRVVLRVAPADLVAGAAMVYLVPLLGLILGAFLVEVAVGGSQGATTAAGIAGLVGGLLSVRHGLRHCRQIRRFEPVFVRSVPVSDVQFT
ncbi:SoxR reducing system RseC family protein [Salicola sp. Rm-C-2C1-2]|uniref:SoxR reducing system RseC family protein n=1 Tax=Salicola sp. Rm-C-2C1-2 TaxID=3141321 RepID=UPI0032E4845B